MPERTLGMRHQKAVPPAVPQTWATGQDQVANIKTKLQERKQTRFNKRMRKRLAVVKEVNIDGLVRTSDRYKII